MKRIAIVALSNGQSKEDMAQIKALRAFLAEHEIESVESPYLLQREGFLSAQTPMKRAGVVNDFFKDPSIDAVFDVSGGDMANEVLPFLDFETILKSRAALWGYSDLTTVINAIYQKTKKASVLFQMKQVVRDDSHLQRRRFAEYLAKGEKSDLFLPRWTKLQGEINMEKMQNATVIGGNIRCFLKLAGTAYMPRLHGNVLFLEALGGTVPQLSTYMAQLSQLDGFAHLQGILLGSFTQMERQDCHPTAYEILKPYLPPSTFVAQTKEVGHAATAKALVIGRPFHPAKMGLSADEEE